MWPINPAVEMREKREAVIMACLNGGQHIDAALEAADRLYPEDKIKAADIEHKERSKRWMEARIEHIEQRAKIIKELDSKKCSPWYASVISRWWPF